MSSYDFIIVGAGPAGLLASLLLSQQGFKVLVLESAKKIKRKVCGEYLCPAGSFLLESLELADLTQDSLKIRGLKIHNYRQKVVQGRFSQHYGVTINRQHFEENLLKKGQKNAADIRFSHTVTNVIEKDQKWYVSTNDGQEFMGKYLIGADGRKSSTAKFLGLKKTIPHEKLAIHCHLKRNFEPEYFGEMHLFRDASYIGMSSITSNEVNLSLVCQAKQLKKFKNPQETINYYLRQSPDLNKRIGEISPDTPTASVYPLNNQVTQVAGKNFAFIGDAAGFLDPLTGEGIYNALWMANTLCGQIIQQKDFKKTSQNYTRLLKQELGRKWIINKVFQWVIKKPFLTDSLAHFLLKKQKRADSFVGLIGNTHKIKKSSIKSS